jgi:hypothetical protein
MNKLQMLKIKRKKLIRKLPPLDKILRSTININYLTCGYKKCKCHQGQKHGPYMYLAYKEKNKTKSYFVPKKMEKVVRQQVNNYKKLINLIHQLCNLNREILWEEKKKKK